MAEWRDTDHIDFGGLWIHWRLRGRVLISPDRDRITPERLRGILFRESLEIRRNALFLKRLPVSELVSDGFAANVFALRPAD